MTLYILVVTAYLMLSLGLVHGAGFSGRTRVIPAEGQLNEIKTFIENELHTFGADTVANTCYMLERGSDYHYTSTLFINSSVHITAEQGSAARPRIIFVALGAESVRCIDPEGDLILHNIEFRGLDTDGNHAFNILMTRGDGRVLYVDNCIFDNYRMEICRTGAAYQKIYFTNNIVRNNYQLTQWNKNRGILYATALPLDSLVVHNNTYFNTPGHVISNFTVSVNYCELSRNTFYNIGGMYQPQQYLKEDDQIGVFDLGPAQIALVQDNLFYNVGFMGVEKAIGDSIYLFNVRTTDAGQTIRFNNNNIYLDQELMDMQPDSVRMLQWFDPGLQKFDLMQSEYSNFSENLTFAHAPGIDSLKELISGWWSNRDSALTAGNSAGIDNSIELTDLNFSYDMLSRSGNSASDGGPLGARYWFDPINQITDDRQHAVPQKTELVVFPNPFNATTRLRYKLTKPAQIKIAIFDINGQQVAIIFRGMKTAGTHEMNISSLDLSRSEISSGVYFIQVKSDWYNGSSIQSRKIVYLK